MAIIAIMIKIPYILVFNQDSKRHDQWNSFQYLWRGSISREGGFMIIIGCIFLIQVDGSITGGGGGGAYKTQFTVMKITE